jgi:hypothetical protein
MINGIDCPYCTDATKSRINCECGLMQLKYYGDAVLHKGKYCNNKYTQCVNYQKFRRELQSEQVKQVAVCT